MKLLLLLIISFSFSQSIDVTFRYIKGPYDTFEKVFVPGTMPPGNSNDWGPNNNGLISPNALSQMIYNPSSDSYEKSYSLVLGSYHEYKNHFHFNSSGADNSWVSDPLNPKSLGGYSLDGYTHDAQVITYNGPDIDYTGREILVGSNANKVVILDVTNKNTITKIAEFDYPQIGYTHQGWFTDDQRYFLLGDEEDELDFGINTRTLVFDFLDLDNPTQIDDYYGLSNAIDHNGYIKGTEFFMACYRAGMRVLDISNIGSDGNQLTEIGYFDSYPANNETAFNGAWSVFPYFTSGNIIINDIERGLFVVRKSGTLGSDEVLKNRFSISPNPTNNNAIIKATQNHQIKSVSIFNILGRKVFIKQNINDEKFVIPLEKSSKGLYIVKINGAISKKLILY